VEISFTARHGIHMSLVADERTFPDRTVYRCTLLRDAQEAEHRRFEAHFQVLAVHPEPPSVDEVLRWLATTVAHLEYAGDLHDWALLHGFMAAGASASPYRGLVRAAASLDDFAESLRREALRFHAFLGPTAYAELLATVDVR
jgi:hypothetical protein